MKINEISENISHTSKRLRDIEREKKVKPGTDEWFKLWFSLPYLKEAFDTTANWQEYTFGPKEIIYGATIAGDEIDLSFTTDRGWNHDVTIDFTRNGDYSQTGEGSQMQIFGAILNKIFSFAKQYNPARVIFSATKIDKDRDSRTKLYRSLINRYATKLGYKLKIINTPLDEKYVLQKKNDIKEAFSSEPDPTGYQHTALTNPQYTIVVNTPGELDWYKLGQHFATLGQQDPHEFGQPESDMMIVAPNKKQLMKYMQELDRLGATYKLTGSSHEHPEVHIESNAFTDARMKAIKAGKKEFSVNGKMYPITGNIQDEIEAKTNESIENFNPQDPMSSSVLIQGYGTANLSTLMKNITNSIKQLGELRNDPDGFRQLKYALYDNEVLKAKLNALVTALDQLQEIKRKGGKRSVNIQKENISEETGKEMLKIFKGMHHDAGMNKAMDHFILSNDWELRDFTPDMFPSEEEFFDYDDPFDRIIDIDYSHRVNLSAPIIVGPQFSDGKYSVIDGNHRAAAAQRMGKTIKGYFPVKKTTENIIHEQKAAKDKEIDWKQGVAEGTLTEYRNALYNFVRSKFPGWPEYVLRDFLYAQAKGIRDQQELKDFLERNQKDFGQVKWRLEKLRITPDIFTPKTQRMIRQREGGLSNPYQVPKDAERHALQQRMIQQQGVSAEPIIVAKLSNGYDLIEGWHRTIQHLQSYPEGYTAPAWVGYGATYTSESKPGVAENFADGKNPGRKGLAKRMGVNTKASVSSLRKTAKNSSGEKQRMAHWLANMKAGREK